MIDVVADLQIWRPVGDGTEEWSRKSGTLRISLELLDQAEQEPAPQNKSCCADSCCLRICDTPDGQRDTPDGQRDTPDGQRDTPDRQRDTPDRQRSSSTSDSEMRDTPDGQRSCQLSVELVRVHALRIECLLLCCNMLRFVFVLSCRNQKWTMIQQWYHFHLMRTMMHRGKMLKCTKTIKGRKSISLPSSCIHVMDRRSDTS